jgi:lipoyl(octanoyl) transferase
LKIKLRLIVPISPRIRASQTPEIAAEHLAVNEALPSRPASPLLGHVLSSSAPLALTHWGRTPYAAALARQTELQAARLAGTAPDTLVLTEHDPVYTLGLRAGADRHLLWDNATRAREGVALHETNRGGDITYHGPGQLVAYAIVSLDSRRDLHAYLRFLEDVLIATVAHHGLSATRREGLTGLWLGTRKLAAIGVAVRRWVTLHGIALNVSPDLRHFAGIVPCGLATADGTVTSLAAELGPRCPTLTQVGENFAAEFTARWTAFITSPAPR